MKKKTPRRYDDAVIAHSVCC